MRPSNKSRSRNKNRRNNNNNNNSGGNILNRVYDSAGPDGRVRGTPQQVIEKYQTLTHDSSLAGDRVAMENFQQHAEHYVRLINEAQRQINERREAMEAQMLERNGGQQQPQPQQNQRRKAADDVATDPADAPQPDVGQPAGEALGVQSNDRAPELVETPEASAKPKPKPRSRSPRKKAPSSDAPADTPVTSD